MYRAFVGLFKSNNKMGEGERGVKLWRKGAYQNGSQLILLSWKPTMNPGRREKESWDFVIVRDFCEWDDTHSHKHNLVYKSLTHMYVCVCDMLKKQ